ncbi:hypothetical protein SAY87_021869 [Trapa incisa]|uniref:Major facilitator superfamily (MFS) profile domain-containing protein n=1 Tax=Trapa incisa TaxID=236973 RepID=A0AAN7JSX4_9MYRT|nr:hypothetical protein SAY87_021869 [Trapa incisa]
MPLKVLSALDSAKTQYYHFKAIIIAGMGLFTDAYDLFCIPPIMSLLGSIYYRDKQDEQEISPAVVSTMVAVALVGTMIGQVVFGYLGDRVGRRRVYGLSLTLMVLSSLGCGFSICTSRSCVLGSLMFFRFLLGLGIGGDYPLSATIMSEFANKTTRGAFIAAVFSMQGFGILASSLVTMVVCSAFNGSSDQNPGDPTPKSADIAWRVILMLGAVPAAFTYYWRMKMPETARYTALVEHNVLQAAKDMEKVLDMSLTQIPEDQPLPSIVPTPSYPLLSRQFFHRHGRNLLSCATAWFLLDAAFYSTNLFQSKIYHRFIPDKSSVNAFEAAFEVAKLQAIVAACSTIPGYWATVYFIERVGRVKIQMFGFLFMAAVYMALGIPYYTHRNRHTDRGFMFLYGLTLFFANFGPNTTTFIVPAELFPARFRSTCHGLSGAAGKLGAIIGSVGFVWASHSREENGYPKAIGMTTSLAILGGVCIVGAVITYLFTPETRGRSLEENEKDDVEATETMNVLRCFRSSNSSIQSDSSYGGGVEPRSAC